MRNIFYLRGLVLYTAFFLQGCKNFSQLIETEFTRASSLASAAPVPLLNGKTPNVVPPGAAIASLGQVISTSSGVINNAVLEASFSAQGAIHYNTTPVQPNYGPVSGLKMVAPGEYFAALVMNDGSVKIPNFPATVANFVFPSGVFIVDAAGGMHNAVFLDSNNKVWTWGHSWNGTVNLSGTGSVADLTGPLLQIQVDANGSAFTNVAKVSAHSNYDAALKKDGTIWLWGDVTGGYLGDGTNGSVIFAPVQVRGLSGVKITKVIFADNTVALDANGDVWTWGRANDYMTNQNLGRAGSYMVPGKVAGLPSGIVDIAAGSGFAYALTSDGQLYGWGYAGNKLGAGTATLPTNTAVSLQQYLQFARPVQSIAANGETTHVILDDGSLWGWGDDAYGLVGDGQELDYSRAAVPYAWDWGKNELMVNRPVRIAPQVSNFKTLYKGNPSVFYAFAVTTDGYVYSWGRGKTGNLMNGIIGANPKNGSIAATYPNSWDVLVPMKVNPFSYQSVEVSSPYCISRATFAPCNIYDIATGKDQ